jgi:hypothetical protein
MNYILAVKIIQVINYNKNLDKGTSMNHYLAE